MSDIVIGHTVPKHVCHHGTDCHVSVTCHMLSAMSLSRLGHLSHAVRHLSVTPLSPVTPYISPLCACVLVVLVKMSRLLRLLPLLLGSMLIASCASGRIDPTDPVGDNAKQIDGIMRLSGYMAAAVGLFVAGAVITAIVKFRERPTDDPNELPKQIHGNRKAELTWTLIPTTTKPN